MQRAFPNNIIYIPPDGTGQAQSHLQRTLSAPLISPRPFWVANAPPTIGPHQSFPPLQPGQQLPNITNTLQAPNPLQGPNIPQTGTRNNPKMSGTVSNVSVAHRYTRLRTLNRGGGFNEAIYLVRHNTNRKIYVCKTITTSRGATRRHWEREINMMRKLNSHPNICQLHEASLTNDGAALYMECCDMGSVWDFVRTMANNRQVIPEPFAWHVLLSLTAALCWMHTGFDSYTEAAATSRKVKSGWRTILHRDMKPDNVFFKHVPPTTLFAHNFPVVKLGDFGLSIYKDEYSNQSLASRNCGYLPWVAPEFPNCGERADVYGVAGIVRAMCVMDPTRAEPGRPILSSYSRELQRILDGGTAQRRDHRPYAKEYFLEVHEKSWSRINDVRIPSWAYKRVTS
ncbi:hypothetical protein FQN51_001357 [Onygenales sp. PD_10]|nr:hypothetical protein FQN51_001357 [Onygenales sp. PD_10]